nr:PREDICTED: butyrophilin subfamily 1 member A1-like isoform X2 [Lepisosteus oculatus]
MKSELDSGWILVLLLCVLQVSVLRSETFRVLGPAGPVVATVGEDTVLPCYLSPSISVLELEIRWFREDFTKPVFLYLNHVPKLDSQLPSYKGRTDLFQVEFTRGNASLRLKDVRGTDDGQYTCMVRSTIWYEEAVIDVAVRALGTQPSVSLHSTGGGQTQLVCRSEGWFPAPAVTWTDRDGQDVTSLSSTTVERDSRGLLSVSSYLPVKQESNIFSCLVRSAVPYPDRGSLLHISGNVFPDSLIWLVALISTAVLWVMPAAFLIHKWRRLHDFPMLHRELDMVRCCRNAEWAWLSSTAADVTLDPDTVQHELLLSGNGKRVRGRRWRDLPDSQWRFQKWSCVVSKEGFSAGQHYWEVKVNKHWTIGIAAESAPRKGAFAFTPGQGYWTLAYNRHNLSALTAPLTPLSRTLLPRTLGVFLDIEERRVSFYKVESREHIYTFSDMAFNEGERLFPLFRTIDTNNDLVIKPPRNHQAPPVPES